MLFNLLFLTPTELHKRSVTGKTCQYFHVVTFQLCASVKVHILYTYIRTMADQILKHRHKLKIHFLIIITLVFTLVTLIRYHVFSGEETN